LNKQAAACNANKCQQFWRVVQLNPSEARALQACSLEVSRRMKFREDRLFSLSQNIEKRILHRIEESLHGGRH